MSQDIVLFEDDILEIGITIGHWGARLSTGLYGKNTKGIKYVKGDTIEYSDLVSRHQIDKLIDNLKAIKDDLPDYYEEVDGQNFPKGYNDE